MPRHQSMPDHFFFLLSPNVLLFRSFFACTMQDAHDNFRLYRGLRSTDTTNKAALPENRIEIHDDGKKITFRIDETGLMPSNMFIIVADVSGSMNRHYGTIRQTAKFIATQTQEANIPEGYVKLIFFSGRINGIVDAGCADALDVIENVYFGGTTDFINPLVQCMDFILASKSDCVNIKFMTDGAASGWQNSSRQLKGILKTKTEAVLEPIFFSTSNVNNTTELQNFETMGFNSKLNRFNAIEDLQANMQQGILSMGSRYTLRIPNIGEAIAFTNGDVVEGVFGIADRVPDVDSFVDVELHGGQHVKQYSLKVVNSTSDVNIMQNLASLMYQYNQSTQKEDRARAIVVEIENLRDGLPDNIKESVSNFLRHVASDVVVDNNFSVQKDFSIDKLMRLAIWDATREHGSRSQRRARRAVDRLAELVSKHRRETSGAIAECTMSINGAFAVEEEKSDMPILGAPTDVITQDICSGDHVVAVLSGLGVAIMGDGNNNLLLSATQAPHSTRAHLTATMEMNSFLECVQHGLSVVNTQMLGVPSIPTRLERTADQIIWVKNAMKIFPMMLLSGIPMLGGSARAMDAFAASAWSFLQDPKETTRVAVAMVLINYYGERVSKIETSNASLALMDKLNGIAISNGADSDGLLPTPAVALCQYAAHVLNGTVSVLSPPEAVVFEGYRQQLSKFVNNSNQTIAEQREMLANAIVEECMQPHNHPVVNLVELGTCTNKDASTMYQTFVDSLRPIIMQSTTNLPKSTAVASEFLKTLASYGPEKAIDQYLQPARVSMEELSRTYQLLDVLTRPEQIKVANNQFGWWNVPEDFEFNPNDPIDADFDEHEKILIALTLLVTEGRTSDIRELDLGTFNSAVPTLLYRASSVSYREMHTKTIENAVEHIVNTIVDDSVLPGAIRLVQFAHMYHLIPRLMKTASCLAVLSNDAYLSSDDVRNACHDLMKKVPAGDYFNQIDAALLGNETVVDILIEWGIDSSYIAARQKTPEKIPSTPNSRTFNRNFRRALARSLDIDIPRKGTIPVEETIQRLIGDNDVQKVVLYAPGYENKAPTTDVDYRVEITPTASQGTLFETHRVKWCVFGMEAHHALVVHHVELPDCVFDRCNYCPWEDVFETMVQSYKTRITGM